MHKKQCYKEWEHGPYNNQVNYRSGGESKCISTLAESKVIATNKTKLGCKEHTLMHCWYMTWFYSDVQKCHGHRQCLRSHYIIYLIYLAPCLKQAEHSFWYFITICWLCVTIKKQVTQHNIYGSDLKTLCNSNQKISEVLKFVMQLILTVNALTWSILQP